MAISRRELLKGIGPGAVLGGLAISGILRPLEALAFHTIKEGQQKNVTEIPAPGERTLCHRDLTFEIIERYRAHCPKERAAKELSDLELQIATAQGAIDEDAYFGDDRVLRFVEHFYMPIGGRKHNGLIVPGLNSDGSRDAVTRAQELWERAREYYNERKIKKAYYTLGRVLHLIEDMAVLEHVLLVNHGPRAEVVALKGGERYDTKNRVLTFCPTPEQIDEANCVIIESGSPFEDYARGKLLNDIICDQTIIYEEVESIGGVFWKVARAGWGEPEMNALIGTFFRHDPWSKEGNGSYKQDTIPDEACERIAKRRIPPLIANGMGLLSLWDLLSTPQEGLIHNLTKEFHEKIDEFGTQNRRWPTNKEVAEWGYKDQWGNAVYIRVRGVDTTPRVYVYEVWSRGPDGFNATRDDIMIGTGSLVEALRYKPR